MFNVNNISIILGYYGKMIFNCESMQADFFLLQYAIKMALFQFHISKYFITLAI